MPTRKTKKDDTALPEKGKSLETAISQIETQFGPGTIMRMGEREVPVSYTHLTLPTM